MSDLVVLMFTALAVLSFLVGLGSLLGGVRFRILARKSRRQFWPAYPPPVAVIVAAKGIAPGLEAHDVIREAAKKSRVRCIVVTAEPVRNATGKAAALIGAAKELTPVDEVLAFMDSDARPPRDWLRSLVAPLQDPSIGAA